MITFQQLTTTSLQTIATTFNKSFEGYYVSIVVSYESLQNKIYTEDIDLRLSVGAFKNDELIGFILHGVRNINDEVVAYNAGTGVLPEYRGQQLTEQMFNYIKPLLIAANVSRIYLEVIEENNRARKVYAKLGFVETRKLLCFKTTATPQMSESISANIITERDSFLPINNEDFFDGPPAWQNDCATVKKLKTTKTYTIENINREVLSFVTINELTNRVVLFATAKAFRKKKYAGLLFSFIRHQYKKELSAINIDAGDLGSITLLKRNGFSNYLRQCEMIKALEST